LLIGITQISDPRKAGFAVLAACAVQGASKSTVWVVDMGGRIKRLKIDSGAIGGVAMQIVYVCDCCKTAYETEEEARQCEKAHSAKCLSCGKTFIRQRSWQVYCSDKCRKKEKERRYVLRNNSNK